MTNKHKKGTKPKAHKQKLEETVTFSPSVKYDPDATRKIFTTSQLSAMIFVWMGVSKLREFSAAMGQGTEQPTSCMAYLDDEETCKHPLFASLIQSKYYSGISLMVLVLSGIWHLWNSESYFRKFMTCLIMGPLTTTMVAVAASWDYLGQNRILHLIAQCLILFVSCAPQGSEHNMFVTENKINFKSFQSMAFLGLALSCLWDVFRVVSKETTLENSVVNTFDNPLPEAARSLVNFWIADKVSMALIFLYALINLPKHTQRTFLLSVAILKVGEYFYQLPNMTDDFQDYALIQQVVMGSGIVSLVGWVL